MTNMFTHFTITSPTIVASLVSPGRRKPHRGEAEAGAFELKRALLNWVCGEVMEPEAEAEPAGAQPAVTLADLVPGDVVEV